MKDQELKMSALDAYLNRVYKIIILMSPMAAMMAAITFTIFKIIGWYEVVSTAAIIIFDFTNLIYLSIAIYLFRTCIGPDGLLRKDKLKIGKIFISSIILIQWNFISYMVPAREFWAYAFFFIVLAVFFFDMKMITVVAGGIVISIIVSWYINGENLMMIPEYYYFLPDLILRIICIILTTSTLFALTYFGGKFLVEELEKYVNYDTLTHLLNRRSMDNYLLQAAYQNAKTRRTTFCLMMIDIDDFKKVNDTYGHDCGDEVLKFVSGVVSKEVGKKDSVFRWGGEEILVLINADEEKAVEIAERIRIEISKDHVNYRDEVNVSITVTIGISPYRSNFTIQSMMDDADQRQTSRKKSGCHSTA